MKTVVALLFCVLTLLVSVHSPARAADANLTSARLLKDELVRLSGTSAKRCGLVALGSSSGQGWRCAVAADRAKQAFWLAVQERGIDSIAWIAVGRDSTGQRYYLVYDSSPYGRAGLHPRFTRDFCSTDDVFDPKRKDLGCRGIAP